MLHGFNYCVIDEVDSILIDEARTPLIISGEVLIWLSDTCEHWSLSLRSCVSGSRRQVTPGGELRASGRAQSPRHHICEASASTTHRNCTHLAGLLANTWTSDKVALCWQAPRRSRRRSTRRRISWRRRWRETHTTPWTRSRRAFSSLRTAMRRQRTFCRSVHQPRHGDNCGIRCPHTADHMSD